MVCCAVKGCSNNQRHQKEIGIKFHTFPKNVETSYKWVLACGRDEEFSVDTARICSMHFDESDYERDLKSELLNLPVKRTLKQNAVPTLKLPDSNVSSKTSFGPDNEKRKLRAEKRSRRREVEEILQKHVVVESMFIENNFANEISTNDLNNTARCQLCNVSDLKIKELEKEVEELKEQNRLLIDRLSKSDSELLRYKTQNEIVAGKFSKCQKQLFTTGRCTNWSSDDIAKAATLRCISYKALGFVRDVLKYPLPSEVTIKRRLRQFVVPPGFIDISLDIMRTQSSLLTNFEKDAILSFDEMKVGLRNDFCFDQVDEVVRGPHNNVQVMVLRSLAGKWMQPIFYNFDTAVSKDLLVETIQVTESVGFKVRAFVCDMGPANRKLINTLNVTFDEPGFKNPYAEHRNIWVFCDVPHALKLLRNHLLDDGYILKSGEVMTKEAFIRLIELQTSGTDLQYAHKLTMNHLLVAGTERQNVRKAAELFSMTVGHAICHNLPAFNHVGEVVKVINNGFDVLNSRIPFDVNKLKSAYGNCLMEQDEALDKLYDTIFTMRVAKKKFTGLKIEEEVGQLTQNKLRKKINEMKNGEVSGLLPFQKGFLMSINSLRCLLKELKSEGYTYIMSSRCNQDILESFFSKVRGLGRFYDHPLPTTVSQRIKTLILSRNASEVMTTNKNYSDDKGVSTLSGDILSGSVSSSQEKASAIQEESDIAESKENDETFDDVDLVFHDFNEQDENAVQQPDLKEKHELLEMIAGYVAYRVKKKRPELSYKYGDLTKNVTHVVGKNWLQTISRGSLIKPTKWFKESVLKMESEFQRFHGNEIDCAPKVFTRLSSLIQKKYPDIWDFAILCFVRTRTFIRMKSLNKRRKCKGIKRSENEQRQMAKKIKKVKL